MVRLSPTSTFDCSYFGVFDYFSAVAPYYTLLLILLERLLERLLNNIYCLSCHNICKHDCMPSVCCGHGVISHRNTAERNTKNRKSQTFICFVVRHINQNGSAPSKRRNPFADKCGILLSAENKWINATNEKLATHFVEPPSPRYYRNFMLLPQLIRFYLKAATYFSPSPTRTLKCFPLAA